MAAPQTLTASNFAETIASSDVPVLVDFWAEWCGPCKAVAPTLQELADDFDGKLVVGKVNVDEHPQVAQQFAIMGIPTFIVFDGGEPVAQFKGALGKTAFIERLVPFID